MNQETIEGWKVLDGEAGILYREYEFTRGAYATTLVFRGVDGLVVVSPTAGLDARSYDALEEFGKVRALIASNSFHHFGQRAWRARFPEAESYCPPGAVAALRKKVAGVPFRPLPELVLPSHVVWEDAPGFKTGETFLSIGSKTRGSIFFAGDLLANIQRTPGPPMSWLFSLTGSAPGFRLFRMAAWVFVKEKKVLREWLLARLDQLPPTIVVPAHGPPVDASDVAEQARAQIRRL